MNDIIEYCRRQPPQTDYIKQKTANNDPTMSKKMRYSQYVKTARKTRVTQTYAQNNVQGPIEQPRYLSNLGQIYNESIISYDQNNKIQLATDNNIRDANSELIPQIHAQSYHRHEK